MTPLEDMEFYEPEETRLTPIAWAEASGLLRKQVVQALTPCSLADGTPIYLHVMGQSSFGGHGKQGIHPERITRLRDYDANERPVLMAFCEGRGAWHWEWFRKLPEPVVVVGIARPPQERRYGWPKSAFRDGGANAPLVLPTDPPAPAEPNTGVLF